MKFHALVNRVQELNGYLTKFPPMIAGLAPTTLEEDKIKEVLYNALPSQIFDCHNEAISEMVGFCKRYEILEEVPIPKKKLSSKKEDTKSFKKSKKRKAHFQSSSEESSNAIQATNIIIIMANVIILLEIAKISNV